MELKNVRMQPIQRKRLGVVLTGIVVFLATTFLIYEFWRLLIEPDIGARDLAQRYREVRLWFDGGDVYGVIGTAVYPPASYAMIWPLCGWMTFPVARLACALFSFGTLAILVGLTLHLTRHVTIVPVYVRALIPIANYSIGAGIGNGQLSLFSITAMIGAIHLLDTPESRGSFRRHMLANALFVFALIKPTLTAPFLCLWLFSARNLRSLMQVSVMYLALVVFAAAYQSDDIATLHQNWLWKGVRGVAVGSVSGAGSNIHTGISQVIVGEDKKSVLAVIDAPRSDDLHSLHILTTLAALLLFGAWTLVHRHVDKWVLAAVIAYVARFWTYHRWYDDVLILIPIVVLLRIASDRVPTRQRKVALILFALTTVFMISPGGLYLLPPPWNAIYSNMLTGIWIAGLIFCIYHAGHLRRRDRDVLPAAE